MSRTKGSKNKPKSDADLTKEFIKEHTPAPVAGNPKFNLNEVEPSETIGSVVAAGAVLPEDLELDSMLDSLGVPEAHFDDAEPKGAVAVKEKFRAELLSEAVDGIKIATTRQEITDQAYLAKAEGCDSIEATLPAIRSITRDPSIETVGYFMYHDIKVYLEGHVARARARDKQTMEQRNFGHSRVVDREKEIKAKIRALEVELEQV